MFCKSLHHAEYRSKDARATVDFYTQVLGLKFIHAMSEDHVPSTGEYGPHIHLFFEMEDGSYIAFFDLPRDDGQPLGWVRHFAFRVADKATVGAGKARLETQGIAVTGPTNHDDSLHSIYFFDPSGHRLELSAHMATAEQDRLFRTEARDVLVLWEQTHDWSQRAALFGGETGYR